MSETYKSFVSLSIHVNKNIVEDSEYSMLLTISLNNYREMNDKYKDTC